ncbi:hypothetical protein [Paraburkholderia solisilvae]|uniref:Uncharacterized protein n=1 Tax=Paraburkholderia solisilvae TaxID=624376 RepID=A0A6J5DFT9_9BURK|nr:hypothetical protein [Paraburkholderia solisilvae]CAB3752793.1 hypothetical protein LMG29739_01587 [Paraburkholderia solisilvae]
MPIIKDHPTFSRLQQLCGMVANWTQHDSDPYGKNVKYCDWLEFKVAGFIDFVSALSSGNGDSEYYFVDVRAMARPKLVLTAGDFPAIKLHCHINQRDYLRELDCLVNFLEGVEYTMGYTNEYAIFPLSMNWHIYGLYDIELARIQSRAPFPAAPFPHEYIPADEAHRLIRLLD